MALRTAPTTPHRLPDARPLGRAIVGLFLASGAAGLVYQVVWSRELVLLFGNTTQAVATIVTAFMAGLGLGGLLGGRLADASRRPLRLYGLLELGVATLAAALPAVFVRLGGVYEHAYNGLLDQPARLAAVRFGLAFAAVAPATLLMGMTLPVLTRHCVRTLDETGRRLGELYAANTLGAMAGTLAAGFVLIELVGLRATGYVAVGLNLLAGIGAQVLDRRAGPASWAGAAPVEAQARPAAGPVPVEARARPAAGPRARPAAGPDRRRLVLAATFVSGFVALALEVLWTRMLAEGTGSSIYVFTTILATFLAGIGGGSALYRRWSRPERDRLGVLGACLAGVGAVALATVVVGSGTLGAIPFNVEALVILLPATLVMGYGFPLAGRLVTPSAERAGGSVGLLYAVNTAGSILGSFAAAFVLAGTIGTGGSVLLLGAIDLVVGATLVRLDPMGRPRRRLVAGGLAALAVAGLAASSADLPVTRTKTENRLRGTGLPVTHTEDALATVDTVGGRREADRRLLIGGVGMTTLTVDTKLMAYLPKMLRPASADFLVVAFGMGGTYRAALNAGYSTDAVELSPSVPGKMPIFFPDAGRYLHHPNGRIHITDGRNWVRLVRRRYDVIAVDPAPPVESAGSVVLYTREFLTEGRARLRPGGIFLLWMPYGLPLEDFKTHARTFAHAFPHVRLLLSPGRHGVYMIGSDAPLAFDDATVRAVAATRTVLGDLTDVPDHPPTSADGWIAAVHRTAWLADGQVAAFAGPGPEITDDHPRSEYFLWRRAFMADRATITPERLRALAP